MSLFKKTEKQSDDKTAYDIHHECTQRESAMKHSRAPFPYEITATGAYNPPAPAINIALIIIYSIYKL